MDLARREDESLAISSGSTLTERPRSFAALGASAVVTDTGMC
jgi:hypothetical protein